MRGTTWRALGLAVGLMAIALPFYWALVGYVKSVV